MRRAAVTCLSALTALLTALGLAAPATAGPVDLSGRPVGHDVSYPQCGGPLPVYGSFGIVGVDGGRPYDPNPCLGELIGWALTRGAPPSYYVNTANPGPKLSSYWPLGQRSPKHCKRSQPDSEACAYVYGWNAAKDSFRRARATARAVGAPSVTSARWWLDVETHNTWESLVYGERTKYLRNDTAVLRGMRAQLRHRGIERVGVYSTGHQWQRITGGARFYRAPVWYAGAGSHRQAVQHCRPAYSFTGGPIRIAQFIRNGFDANLRC